VLSKLRIRNPISRKRREPGSIPKYFYRLSQKKLSRWGLTQLGYLRGGYVAFSPKVDTWHIEDYPDTAPYIVIYWLPEDYLSKGKWNARFTVVVPVSEAEAQRGKLMIPPPGHRSRLIDSAEPNWVDLTTGAQGYQSQLHYQTPGIAVYTTIVSSREEFLKVLAQHDYALHADPEQYILQAALLRNPR